MASRHSKPDPFKREPGDAPLTQAEIARLRPGKEVLSRYGIEAPKPVGRPKSDNPKVAVSIRLDRDVVDYFKSQGPGWQTRVNETLLSSLPNNRSRNET